MSILKKISFLTLLSYGSVFALAILFFALEPWQNAFQSGSQETALYYFSAAGASVLTVVLISLRLLIIFVVCLAVVSLLRNIMKLVQNSSEPPTMFGSSSIAGSFKSLFRTLKKIIIAVLPGLAFITLLSFILGDINHVDRLRLVDTGILSIEHNITGHYLFILLGNIHYPAPFIKFVIFSFNIMSVILMTAVFFLAALNYRVLRELVAAFCFGMLIFIPLWIAFPALSPQDRFVNNVYDLSVSPDIAAALAAYHPDQQIAQFLSDVRMEKQGLSDLPTSTLPSAHIFWAILAAYYLFRARSWLGWIALPFIIASSLGTIVLAQHYFLDVVVSLVISFFVIWIVDGLSKRDIKRALAITNS